jgi:hypothetical protein
MSTGCRRPRNRQVRSPLSVERSTRLRRARLVLAGFGWRVFFQRYRLPLFAAMLGLALIASLATVAVLAIEGGSSSSTTVRLQPYAAAMPAVPTNHVTGSGTASVQLRGETATVTLTTTGLLAGSPHLAHIHGLGLGTCPTAANARRHNGHLSISTSDGIHSYGSSLVSLTEWGSTSGSVPNNIDMNRYPASGTIRYERTMTVSKLVADLIRDGDAVIVVHGIDYNYNHVYDFQALGVSDLDHTFPGEATAPALCGPLRRALQSQSAPSGSATTYVASLKPSIRSVSAAVGTADDVSPLAPGDAVSREARADRIVLFCHIGQATSWPTWT